MPSLGNLECWIEIEPYGVKLDEYKTQYHNSALETYVAVPEHPTAFSIVLNVDGYVAPGLSVYVFIDGIFQACQNKSTGHFQSGQSKGYGDRRIKQMLPLRFSKKEQHISKDRVISRDLRFAKFDIANPGKWRGVDKDIIVNLGNIEVVVFRSDEPDPNMLSLPMFKDNKGKESKRFHSDRYRSGGNSSRAEITDEQRDYLYSIPRVYPLGNGPKEVDPKRVPDNYDTMTYDEKVAFLNSVPRLYGNNSDSSESGKGKGKKANKADGKKNASSNKHTLSKGKGNRRHVAAESSESSESDDEEDEEDSSSEEESSSEESSDDSDPSSDNGRGFGPLFDGAGSSEHLNSEGASSDEDDNFNMPGAFDGPHDGPSRPRPRTRDEGRYPFVAALNGNGTPSGGHIYHAPLFVPGPSMIAPTRNTPLPGFTQQQQQGPVYNTPSSSRFRYPSQLPPPPPLSGRPVQASYLQYVPYPQVYSQAGFPPPHAVYEAQRQELQPYQPHPGEFVPFVPGYGSYAITPSYPRPSFGGNQNAPPNVAPGEPITPRSSVPGGLPISGAMMQNSKAAEEMAPRNWKFQPELNIGVHFPASSYRSLRALMDAKARPENVDIWMWEGKPFLNPIDADLRREINRIASYDIPGALPVAEESTTDTKDDGANWVQSLAEPSTIDETKYHWTDPNEKDPLKAWKRESVRNIWKRDEVVADRPNDKVKMTAVDNASSSSSSSSASVEADFGFFLDGTNDKRPTSSKNVPSRDHWTRSVEKDSSLDPDTRSMYPEMPLYSIPANLVRDGVEWQMRAGPGAVVKRKLASANLWDKWEKPYAVFTFKYRSREALRQRFGPKVVGKQSAKELAASLRSLSKDDLVKLMVDRSLKEQEEKEEKEEKESTGERASSARLVSGAAKNGPPGGSAAHIARGQTSASAQNGSNNGIKKGRFAHDAEDAPAAVQENAEDQMQEEAPQYEGNEDNAAAEGEGGADVGNEWAAPALQDDNANANADADADAANGWGAQNAQGEAQW